MIKNGADKIIKRLSHSRTIM